MEEGRVEKSHRYDLHSVRRFEYESSQVSRVSESPALNTNNIHGEVNSTPLQSSQVGLFNSELEIPGAQRTPIVPITTNVQKKSQLLDLKKKMVSSSVKTEQLAHHLKFLTTCQEKSIIPQGLLLD